MTLINLNQTTDDFIAKIKDDLNNSSLYRRRKNDVLL